MATARRPFSSSTPAAEGLALQVLRCAVVVVVVVILQLSLISRLTIGGVRPDVVLLLAIAAAIAAGPEVGAVVGFAAGLLVDLMLPGPAGISALAFCLVGYAVGLLQSSVLRAAWWIPVASALLASAAGETLYAVLREVLGRPVPSWGHVPTIVGVVALVNALLAIPLVGVARWMVDGRLRRRDRAGLR